MTQADRELLMFDAREGGQHAQALLRWHADCDSYTPPPGQVQALRAALLAGASALLEQQAKQLDALECRASNE